ncbi:MAG: archease [Acidobacteriota bacterium]
MRLRAGDLAGLFRAASRGLFALLMDGKARRHPAVSMCIKSTDTESLLVDWLNELLYLHTVGRWVLVPGRIHIESGTQLVAALEGEPFDPRRHHVRQEVKAATFHGLRITRANGVWSTDVVFDL